MSITTVFAQVHCSVGVDWYSKLFGRSPDREPSAMLAEWQFTDSAEVQLVEDIQGAGAGGLTLGLLPLTPRA